MDNKEAYIELHKFYEAIFKSNIKNVIKDADKLDEAFKVAFDYLTVKKPSCLNDDEIETFQSYIDDDDMQTAFGNSDWCEIYSKITNGTFTGKAIRLKEHWDEDGGEY